MSSSHINQLQHYIHEHFRLLNDVGIIIVNRTIPRFYFENVLLAYSPSYFFSINPLNCYLAGWGSTWPFSDIVSDQLNEVMLQLFAPQFCQQIYPFFNFEYTLCIGTAPGKGSCLGDSGGPFMCSFLSNPNQFLIIGINSIGPIYCASVPSVVTRVSKFIEWIMHYSSNESRTPPRNPDLLF